MFVLAEGAAPLVHPTSADGVFALTWLVIGLPLLGAVILLVGGPLAKGRLDKNGHLIGAALPVLSDIQGRGDPVRARATALKWSGMMVLAGAVACLIGWLLAPWGVALLFQRGAFTAQNTAAVAQVLRWGLLQLPFYFGVLMLVQLLASQNRYRIMAAIAVANFALKAVMNEVLAPRMGVEGIMLATSIMYVLSYVCYVVAAWASSPAAARGRP